MPTTLNSMTHFTLNESQEDLMDGEPGEIREALRKTAVVVLAVALNRLQEAIDSGLIIDNTLPTPEPPPATEAPVNVDVPHAQQSGNTLTCTMGNWEGEPTSYEYAWMIDDMAAGEFDTITVTEEDVGKTATCVVTATNAAGSTDAPPSNGVVVEPF